MDAVGKHKSRIGHRLISALDRASLVGADDRPVFVGGCPRSGTTLLRTMLHSHPDLAIPRETTFLLETWWRRRDFGNLQSRPNRDRLIQWLTTDFKTTRFKRLELDLDEARKRMGGQSTLGSILGTAFQMFSERNGAKRWGDKRPMYILHLPVIMRLFPDVQFINVVRDPRAVIASMRKLGWLDEWSEGTVIGGLERWIRSIRAGRYATHRYRNDQFLELRYEDLTSDPALELKRICSFTGLDDGHVETMLSFHEMAGEIPDKQRSKYHPNLERPVTSELTHTWTSSLTEEEVALIELATANWMGRYGYDREAEERKISRELQERWDESVARHRSWWRPPRTRTVSYPYPVGARLTTAQRRRSAILGLGRRR